MTEDEAKQKWCPFARVSANESDPACNRSYSEDRGQGAEPKLFRASRCVGTACMAWRTRPDFNPITNPEGAPIGFCGLAGAPS